MATLAHAADAKLPSAIVLRGLFDGAPDLGFGNFVTLWPGVEMLPIYGILESGEPISRKKPSAAFLRYAPGASVPAHRHPGFEHIVVLEGSQSDDRGTYGRGTCLVSTPGSVHRVASSEGCLVLAIWTESVEVLDVDDRP